MLFLMILFAAIFDADSNRYKGNNTYTRKRRYNRTTRNKYWEDAHYWHLNYGD